MKALFVGRFQPFHNGHLLVIQHLSHHYEEIIIGIGSSQYKNTQENPFSVEERTLMITRSLDAIGIHNYRIVPIPDINDPPHWVAYVRSIIPEFDVVISNNPFTQKLFSEKGYLVKGTTRFERAKYSGKEIRRRIIHNEPWENLVPTEVKQILKKIRGVQRIKNSLS